MDPLLRKRFEHAANHCAELTPADLDALKLLYDAEILELDSVFHRFLRKLKEVGIYDDALIILMSDHGEEFLEHDNLLHGKDVYQETARVPLLIKFPKGSLPAGSKRVKTWIQLTDVLPTILDLLNIKLPETAQGASMLPLILHNDESAFLERTMFVESGNQKGAILRGRYKYIYSRVIPSPRSCAETRAEELYDLQEDPGEKEDLTKKLPQFVNLFREQRRKYEEQAAAFRKARKNSSRTFELDPAVQEQMRALGYLQ